MSDSIAACTERLVSALTGPEPFVAARSLAIDLRDAGMPQSELLALFDAARQRHSTDADEARYNAVLDVMDLIVGHCIPSSQLYPAELNHLQN